MQELTSRLMTLSTERNELVQVLAEGTKGIAVYLNSTIAEDSSRDDAVWITGIRTDSDSLAASPELPAVQEALAKGRPMMTGMGSRTATRPVGRRPTAADDRRVAGAIS